ncbi:MAG: hypothetical protein M1817_005862 [Caeruleum heppii]|nr:MAG: hypothetical protein M1817_005862 [Caeruleum heppii]
MTDPSRRTSTHPPRHKPPTSLSPNIVIHDIASLVGTHRVTIGQHSVLHPRAKIISTHAPVTIGESCEIGEKSSVGVETDGGEDTDEGVLGEGQGTLLEDYVTVEPGAVVEAARVGEGTVIEVNARVGRGAIVGKHCKITPLCEVPPGDHVPDYTVIYGMNERRIDRSQTQEMRILLAKQHVALAKKLLTNNVAKWTT